MTVARQKRPPLPEGDDGRTIVNMDVDGMPWYLQKRNQAQPGKYLFHHLRPFELRRLLFFFGHLMFLCKSRFSHPDKSWSGDIPTNRKLSGSMVASLSISKLADTLRKEAYL